MLSWPASPVSLQAVRAMKHVTGAIHPLVDLVDMNLAAGLPVSQQEG